MALPSHFEMRAAGGKTISVPSVGYGTWASGDKTWCKDATLAALKAGYRHLDCAWKYGVDDQIGQAIKESGVPRSDIFITSKFWPHFAAPENVELALDKILKGMGLEYIDLFLAHWPIAIKPTSRSDLEAAEVALGSKPKDEGQLTDPTTGAPVVDWEHTTASINKHAGKSGSYVPTWQALQKLVATGKTRAVGVSNFSIADLQEIVPHQGDVPISCNQIEVHPWLPNSELISFMKDQGILATCYSPFAGQKEDGETLLKDKTVLEVAGKNDMDVGQCLQSWAVGRGTIPLGKSQSESRIKSNLVVRKLPQQDMQALDALAQPDETGRTVNPSEGWGVKLF